MRHYLSNSQSSILASSVANQGYRSTEYKAIFKTLLFGSFVLVTVLTILLLVSYFSLHNTYVSSRIIICGVALLYLAVTYAAWTKGYFAWASRLLILFYYSVATVVMLGWGLDITFAQLMMAITIVLAGILLGSRSALVTGGLATVSMLVAQAFVETGNGPWFIQPEVPSTFGDVVGFGALLGILALISALSSKHDRDLHAKDLEQNEALTKQKGTLEQRVRGQTLQLKTMQLEEMDQLYKFAEIGQLSAAMLHNIANHLTVLNVDLADLKKQRGSKTVNNLKESIGYIEEAISQARDHLQVKDAKHNFDVLSCIEDSIKLPRFQEARSAITVNGPEKHVSLYGESLRLSHVLTVLIRNAIEAYPANTPRAKRYVTLDLASTKEAITITVSDNGQGIPADIRENLFSPLRSTKKDGLGLGLFIAKKITETHFNGTLTLGKTNAQTAFVLTIPRNNKQS